MGQSTGREGQPIAEAFAGVHCGTSRRGANDGRAKEMGGRAACGPFAVYVLSLLSRTGKICAEPVLCPSNGWHIFEKLFTLYRKNDIISVSNVKRR